MTIYRTLYNCLPYIHTRRESLFSFFFFFLTPLPLKRTERHAEGERGQRRFVQQSCCLHMPVRAFYWPDLFYWTNESWVCGQMSQSSCVHVSMWLHAASPWCWYAHVSLSPVRFPQLIYFTMALRKMLAAATLSLPHSFTSPTIYYYRTFLVVCWFLWKIAGILRFEED